MEELKSYLSSIYKRVSANSYISDDLCPHMRASVLQNKQSNGSVYIRNLFRLGICPEIGDKCLKEEVSKNNYGKRSKILCPECCKHTHNSAGVVWIFCVSVINTSFPPLRWIPF